ncbi:lipase maturation factor 1-like isoform X1 [Portunus trituberculatus]|uniref:lipase maturation factor 1-like isoform X1 n=1 Tax=Portunus trituberculatus TaxID=210409 RepID=UPI001E1CCBD5|nr:lipase maturation factor 1-like isoform X1 [Portunus trituberculatus]
MEKEEESQEKDKKSEEESEGRAERHDATLLPDSYWLTRIVYLRFLAFIYAVAFLVALHQNKQLIGDNGLLPVKNYMQLVAKRAGSDWWERIKAAPTLLWLAEPWTTQVDPWLDLIAGAGLTLACVVLLLGAANVFIMLALWILYHSLVAVGQQWYGFGWESQLLETGLLGVWGVPLLSLRRLPTSSPPPLVLVWGLRWLIFRIMMGAGLIKVRGDPCWMDLTCMNYHYQTQPVPNPMSYYLHQSPEVIHKLETLGNHIIELLLPLFTFLPRSFMITCGIGQIMFQVILIISGNLSFLNWLTIVPSLAYFDDRWYAGLFSRATHRRVAHLQHLQQRDSPLVDPGNTRKAVNVSVGIMVAFLSLPVVVNLLSSRQAMNTSFEPFRIVNTYGAFGSITKQRTEVVFEGTHHSNPESPSAVWEEYEFKCKPGRVDRTPCLISPYHYRLDWLMWFAAFQRYSDNPWLVHLAGKFLVNDKTVSSLIAHNPFLGKEPPRFVRALHYSYNYTSVGSGSQDWYTRELIGTYLPPLDISTLKPIFKRMNWATFVTPATTT